MKNIKTISIKYLDTPENNKTVNFLKETYENEIPKTRTEKFKKILLNSGYIFNSTHIKYKYFNFSNFIHLNFEIGNLNWILMDYTFYIDNIQYSIVVSLDENYGSSPNSMIKISSVCGNETLSYTNYTDKTIEEIFEIFNSKVNDIKQTKDKIRLLHSIFIDIVRNSNKDNCLS